MKVDGTLGSLVQGVSQQPPSARRLGQHGEQVNMLADPVRQLSRRPGTQWLAELYDPYSNPANAAANNAEFANFRTFDYLNGTSELTVLYRAGKRPVGSDLSPIMVFDKSSNQFLNIVRNAVDTVLDQLTIGGISAIAAAGKYVFMAGHDVVPAGTSTPRWADPVNQAQTVLWVRGGAYSRTFKATVTLTSGTQITFEHTTPSSSYPGTLDTSTVPVYVLDPAGGTTSDTEALYVKADGGYGVAKLGWGAWTPTGLTVKNGSSAMTNVYPAMPANSNEFKWNPGAIGDSVWFHPDMIGRASISATYTHIKTLPNPHYSNVVGDITSAFNSAVTNWIGDAAAAIQPAKIAEGLRDAALSAGVSCWASDGTVVFTDVKDILVNDGGDGTLAKGLANTCKSVSDLTDAHFVGKVVMVQPTGAEAFYMKATAKNSAITSGVTEVLWVEGAAVTRTIDSALCYGVSFAGNFYVASTAALLNTILPDDHPTFAEGTAGDDDTSPMPHFVGRRITYLGMFQDRLIVGAGSVLRFSRTGDYLNFFRGSVLTVAANDPFEVVAQGTEDDVIKFGALYDRDLYLFGKRQYAIPGRAPLTPTSINLPVVASHKGTDDAPPVAAGGLIFYAKRGQGSASVHQIEPGRNAESPEAYTVSSQLYDYLAGDPVELLPVPKPTTLLIRMAATPNSLFVYSYLDSNQGRLQDCWHRWDYSPRLGPILGMTDVREGVVIFTLRTAEDGRQFVVADLQSLDGGLNTRPYLDSTQPYADVLVGTGTVTASSLGYAAAYASGTPQYMLGAPELSQVPALIADLGHATGLTVGTPFTSEWSPTNPAVHDSNGKSMKAGRLVVTSLLVEFRDSSGFESVVTTYGRDAVYAFNGRLLGDPNNQVGRVPITDGTKTIPVGRAAGDYSQVIKALDWLPLNLTSVEWTGQLFHRPQRIG